MSDANLSSGGTPAIQIKKEDALRTAYETLKIKYNLTIEEYHLLNKDYKRLKKAIVELLQIKNEFFELHGCYEVEKPRKWGKDE